MDWPPRPDGFTVTRSERDGAVVLELTGELGIVGARRAVRRLPQLCDADDLIAIPEPSG